MVQKPTVYFLSDFNEAVLEGHIMEVDVSGPSQSIRVVCTEPLFLHGQICGAHLRDTWLVTIQGERYFEIYCGACGWKTNPKDIKTYRRLGKSTYMNGKGESE